MAYRRYSEDIRADAIRLVTQDGHAVAGVARTLGVSSSTLQRWIADAAIAARPPGSDRTVRPGVDPPLPCSESVRLEARLEELGRRLERLESRLEQVTERHGSASRGADAQ